MQDSGQRGNHTLSVTITTSASYEGLRAVLIATIDEAVTSMPSYEGFIYEGEPSSLPDPVEPFTQ